MIAPLYWRDESIGTLHFRSERPDAYTSSELRLADEVATQISGIVAGSISYTELLTESSEREVLADISRAIASSQQLDESFQQLADSVADLIQWDRFAITSSNENENSNTYMYRLGIQEAGDNSNYALFMMRLLHEVFRTDLSPIVVDEKMESKYIELRQAGSTARSIGLQSWLLAPLMWRDEQIGHIHLRSKYIDAYDESHIHLIARISDHISGAFAGIFANKK